MVWWPRVDSSCSPSTFAPLGQAEVEDLDAPVARDEQVRGLQVAVDDPLVVRRREAGSDLQAALERLADWQDVPLQTRLECLAREQLRDREEEPLLLADIEEGEDVRMRERGHDPRFLLEARERLLSLRQPRRQDLHRDVARQPRVARPVNLAHSARAQERRQLVGTEVGAGREGHRITRCGGLYGSSGRDAKEPRVNK